MKNLKQNFIFLTISLLTSFFSPVHGAEQKDCVSSMRQQNKFNLNIESFDGDIFEETVREMWAPVKQSEGKEIVIFMGPTKSGKSTTANYLRDLPMEKYEDEYYKELIRVDFKQLEKEKEKYKGVKIAPIGNDDQYGSCTRWPLCYCYKDNKFQFTFCDFPGLEDAKKSIEKDSAIALSTKSAIDHSEGVKAIILFISEPDLNSGAGELVKRLFEAVQLMLNNPQEYAPSIFFALTRTERKNSKKLMGEIKRFRAKLEQDAQKTFPFLTTGHFEKLRRVNDRATFERSLESIDSFSVEKAFNALKKFSKGKFSDFKSKLRELWNGNENRDSIEANFNKYNTLKDLFSVDLYIFLNCMLSQHQENFLVINPLDREAITPILDKISKCKVIPKQKFKFIGTPKTYTSCLNFYISVAENARTLFSERQEAYKEDENLGGYDSYSLYMNKKKSIEHAFTQIEFIRQEKIKKMRKEDADKKIKEEKETIKKLEGEKEPLIDIVKKCKESIKEAEQEKELLDTEEEVTYVPKPKKDEEFWEDKKPGKDGIYRYEKDEMVDKATLFCPRPCFELHFEEYLGFPYEEVKVVEKFGKTKIEKVIDRSIKERGQIGRTYTLEGEKNPRLSLQVIVYKKYQEKEEIERLCEKIAKKQTVREEADNDITGIDKEIAERKDIIKDLESSNGSKASLAEEEEQIQKTVEKEMKIYGQSLTKMLQKYERRIKEHEEAFKKIKKIEKSIEEMLKEKKLLFDLIQKTYHYITDKGGRVWIMMEDFEKKVESYRQYLHTEYPAPNQVQAFSIDDGYTYEEEKEQKEEDLSQMYPQEVPENVSYPSNNQTSRPTFNNGNFTSPQGPQDSGIDGLCLE